MKYQDKTKEELIEELTDMRKRASELEELLTESTLRRHGPDESDSLTIVPSEGTQTIDLTALFAVDVTSSGSFDIGGDIWVTTFGKVLQALPGPVMLIDGSHQVIVANQACGKIDPEYDKILGTPFATLFSSPASAEKARSLISEIFLTRKPQTFSAMLKIGNGTFWGRASLRSIRIMQERYILVIIEDLTAEQNQILADRKHWELLQKAYDELEDRNRLLRREVTDRKLAENALRESEQRFRELAEFLPQIVYESDAAGNFTFVNKSGLDFSGYTEEDIAKGLIAFEAVVPEDRARLASNMEKVLSGERRSDEYDFLTKDGRGVPLQVFAAPIVRNDQICGIRGVAIDISELKSAQKALVLGRESFNSIVERSVDGILVLDSDGKVLYANASAASLFGRSKEDVAKPWFRNPLVHHKMTEVRVILPNGEIGLAEMRLERTHWQGKSAYLAMLRDVTERRKAEEALKRLATAVDQSAETIIITDQEGIVQYVNPAFEQTSQYCAEEVLGKKTRFWNTGDHHETSYDQLENTVRSGNVWKGRFRSKRKDGTTYDEDATISPVRDASGKIVNYVTVKRDITQQIELEEQLRRAQKMEAVGTLAGGIAHDFNNLLQVITGYGELLSTQMEETDPRYEDLQIMLKAGERGADLVQSILTFSRKADTHLRPSNLNEDVKLARKLLLRTIPKMIDIELHLADDLKTVNADPSQMEQVLLNLAVNARDAMPDGGRLIIETENVNLDEEYCRRHLEVKPGHYVRLSISDTGRGMTPEVVDRIFEPFYTTKGVGKGTGLGLSMVFGIVKSHEGHIRCSSEPGVGTTFKIDFPVLETEIETEVAETAEMPAFGTETILVVDDEDHIRELAKRYLAKVGYTVLLAGNGAEALEIYRDNQPYISLVVLDLIMPKMGGNECLDELLKIDSRAKVLMASGFFADGSTKEAATAGAKGFVGKPFKIKEMLREIRRVLNEG